LKQANKNSLNGEFRRGLPAYLVKG